jgi:hypothetical protein
VRRRLTETPVVHELEKNQDGIVGVRLVEPDIGHKQGTSPSLGAPGAREGSFRLLDALFGDLFGNGKEQIFLGAKILIARSLRKAGVLADFGDRGVLEPLTAKIRRATSIIRSFLLLARP